MAIKQKEDYSTEYEKQKAEAIKNGLFREDIVKSPPKDIDIFGKLFSKESKDKGIKFSKDNNYLVRINNLTPNFFVKCDTSL